MVMVAYPTPVELIKIIIHIVIIVYINAMMGPKVLVNNTLPCNIGTNWPTIVSPPAPKYCPAATSWKKIGIPQANMEIA